MTETSNINVPPSKLIVDIKNEKVLPKRFRTTLDEVDKSKTMPNLKGFRELNMSGSGVFSQKGLQKVKETINSDNIIVVDTRKESHGYVNGMPITWYGENNYTNKQLTPTEVLEVERQNLYDLNKTDSITFDFREGKSLYMEEPIKDPKLVQSESEMVKSEGLDYVRFFITDHNKPSDEEVDKFITFVKALSGDEWLHIHCRGGVGRTTTFMILYDMMKNIEDISFEDFLTRQILIGGRDMNRLAEGTYKHEAAVERLNFIKMFYEYCKESYQNNFELNWSQWLANKN